MTEITSPSTTKWTTRDLAERPTRDLIIATLTPGLGRTGPPRWCQLIDRRAVSSD